MLIPRSQNLGEGYRSDRRWAIALQAFQAGCPIPKESESKRELLAVWVGAAFVAGAGLAEHLGGAVVLWPPARQVKCMVVLHGPFKGGRVGGVLSQQGGFQGWVRFGEHIKGIGTEGMGWESPQQRPPSAAGPLLLTQSFGSPCLMEQHCCSCWLLPPGLTCQQALMSMG